MVGAPFLAAKAALRIGAGLVTIASSPEVVDMLEKRVEEIMTLRISKAADIFDFIEERKVNSLVIGPGLKDKKLTLGLLKTVDLPCVVDGGALADLALEPELFSHFRTNVILTPHLGEFQRFFNKKLLKDELKQVAREFARQKKIILVLKGHPTYVAEPSGDVYINKTGGPGLATAGTGDVLAGMISGLIAQHVKPIEAAKAAVYLHGLAGDLASEQKTQPGLIASDVIEAIPRALKQTQ